MYLELRHRFLAFSIFHSYLEFKVRRFFARLSSLDVQNNSQYGDGDERRAIRLACQGKQEGSRRFNRDEISKKAVAMVAPESRAKIQV